MNNKFIYNKQNIGAKIYYSKGRQPRLIAKVFNYLSSIIKVIRNENIWKVSLEAAIL